MLNRSALILRYKEPAVRWINEADPNPDGLEITLEDVNEERTVYLIDAEVADTPEQLRKWSRPTSFHYSRVNSAVGTSILIYGPGS